MTDSIEPPTRLPPGPQHRVRIASAPQLGLDRLYGLSAEVTKAVSFFALIVSWERVKGVRHYVKKSMRVQGLNRIS